MALWNATFLRIPLLMNTSVPAYQSNTATGDANNITHISLGQPPDLGENHTLSTSSWNATVQKTSNARRFNVVLSRKDLPYGFIPAEYLAYFAAPFTYALSVSFRIIYNNLL
jgi:hypothetical protein